LCFFVIIFLWYCIVFIELVNALRNTSGVAELTVAVEQLATLPKCIAALESVRANNTARASSLQLSALSTGAASSTASGSRNAFSASVASSGEDLAAATAGNGLFVMLDMLCVF
jgi:hypothetical protein